MKAGQIVMLNGPPRAGPPGHRPGTCLRLGGERPDLETVLPTLYAAMCSSIAAQSRPLGILRDAARRLLGLPVLFVGVRCSIETMMEHRRAGQAGREGRYLSAPADEKAPAQIERW